jgi:hypothetical protein
VPPPGFKNLTLSDEATAAVDKIVVLMTIKYKRRFKTSQALIQAAKDLAEEMTK